MGEVLVYAGEAFHRYGQASFLKDFASNAVLEGFAQLSTPPGASQWPLSSRLITRTRSLSLTTIPATPTQTLWRACQRWASIGIVKLFENACGSVDVSGLCGRNVVADCVVRCRVLEDRFGAQ